jgi:hypothetical protein
LPYISYLEKEPSMADFDAHAKVLALASTAVECFHNSSEDLLSMRLCQVRLREEAAALTQAQAIEVGKLFEKNNHLDSATNGYDTSLRFVPIFKNEQEAVIASYKFEWHDLRSAQTMSVPISEK